MFINFFNSIASFSSILSSITDSFNFFSDSKVRTFDQSHIVVNLVYNFDLYSFVFKMAILINRVVGEVNKKPMLGLTRDKVEVVIADPEPNKTSVIINIIFFRI